ncbi:MAG: hypothetical protein MUP66_02295 [Candidatus Nanohaloarchaeota archaeon QJJ-5]|nr:hypothetical protein [Candidatus Nanohaloarchaeota archaeon QJJ-5]
MLVIFAGFATVLLGATSAFLSYLLMHDQDDAEDTTSLIFLALICVFISLSGLLFTMKEQFGLETFIGLRTTSGVPLTMLFAVIAVNAVIWQFREHQ